jgi:DNA modification methylase
VTPFIYHGDCRKILPDLDTASVQLVCTSPPYFGQRRYGENPDAEIGWGTLDNYLAEMATVLDECHRILDADGTMWIVIGDKAAGSGGAGGDHLKKGSKNWIPTYGKVDAPVASGQWMLVPYQVAALAQTRGWLVRSMIVWDKSPNVKPEDMRHTNRPMIASERIIMLTKKVRHRFHPDRLVEKGDVWHIRPHRGAGAARHFAPYPADIPRRIILAASDRGDTVLDPFNGSGTTTSVAHDLGRHGVGIELYGQDPTT